MDDRRVLNAVFYALRTGSPWRDLPERDGPYTTAYNRWARAGVWLRIFEALAARSPQSLHLIDRRLYEPTRMRQAEKGRPDHAIGRSPG